MRNFLDLTGTSALITGASSGIGAATAKCFAELGARVAIGYHRNAKGAKAIQQQIEAAGGHAVALEADVRQPSQIRQLIEQTVSQLGPIDILVNNAGTLIERLTFDKMTQKLWDEVINLNLTSAMLAAQAVAPAMTQRRTGSIINIVSIAGRNGGGPGAGAYATAKGGLITLTKALAKELAPHNVRVNAVSPGVIDTPFHEVHSTPEMIANFVKAVPMGRVGTSEEVATVIAFLASNAAAYITGETIEVNGGQLML
ncbi:MAG TPA: SDR family NAD(P)-dependent oxidoreductase [Bryobacteraceae bacterium]|nr:SDR family NAD(P)-dependent oxidoreductase [Bryobacteraceae bacterium]